MALLRYLHTMIRVTDLEKSLKFYTEGLGFQVSSRNDYEKDRFSLVFLRSNGNPDGAPELELTHNWDTHQYDRGNAYGHMAYWVKSIDEVQARLKQHGYDLSWGPGASPGGNKRIAFIDDPDGYEIELIEG